MLDTDDPRVDRESSQSSRLAGSKQRSLGPGEIAEDAERKLLILEHLRLALATVYQELNIPDQGPYTIVVSTTVASALQFILGNR